MNDDQKHDLRLRQLERFEEMVPRSTQRGEIEANRKNRETILVALQFVEAYLGDEVIGILEHDDQLVMLTESHITYFQHFPQSNGFEVIPKREVAGAIVQPAPWQMSQAKTITLTLIFQKREAITITINANYDLEKTVMQVAELMRRVGLTS